MNKTFCDICDKQLEYRERQLMGKNDMIIKEKYFEHVCDKCANKIVEYIEGIKGNE